MRGSVGSTIATAFPVARALWAPLSAEERRHSRPSSRNASQMRSVNGQGSAPMYTHNSQCVVTNDSPATRRLTRRLAYTGSVSLQARCRSVELCRLRSDCTAAWGDVML